MVGSVALPTAMPEFTHAHQFPSTRWTIVGQAAGNDQAIRRKALTELCELYWPPVYAFIRSKGNSPHDAEDLAQGFFAQLLTREDLAHTDASKGKLRTFLLRAAKNYMSNEWKKANRQKRGGGKVLLSLDAGEGETLYRAPEPRDDLTPDRVFERQWVLTLLKHVLSQLERRYEKDGKAPLFEALKPTLTPGAPMPPYAEVAAALEMSEAALKVAVHRLRQRYGVLLKECIADTLGPGEDPDEELSSLMTAFS